MLEQYDEHRLGNSVAVAARIIYRLSKLVPDNMDRSGLFSFFSFLPLFFSPYLRKISLPFMEFFLSEAEIY